MSEFPEGTVTWQYPQPGQTFGFGMALEVLRGGGRVTRKGWNGPGQAVQLQKPDEFSKMTLPYLYLTTTTGDLVPWIASQADVLGDDWMLAGG